MLLRGLVACECSGRVREALAARGNWEVWSADLLDSETPVDGTFEASSTGVPRIHGPETLGRKNVFHYKGDVRDLFNWNHPLNQGRRVAADEVPVYAPSLPLWDLIIAHPPCDHLSYAGARWFEQKQADGRQAAAAQFFMGMVNAPSPLVAVENPHSVMQKLYRPPDQVAQPWWFGDPYAKQIHLWLKGLPPLEMDQIVEPTGRVTTGGGSWRTDKAAGKQGVSAYEDSEGRANRAKVRSRTFPGLARAIADQWGAFAEREHSCAQ